MKQLTKQHAEELANKYINGMDQPDGVLLMIALAHEDGYMACAEWAEKEIKQLKEEVEKWKYWNEENQSTVSIQAITIKRLKEENERMIQVLKAIKERGQFYPSTIELDLYSKKDLPDGEEIEEMINEILNNRKT